MKTPTRTSLAVAAVCATLTSAVLAGCSAERSESAPNAADAAVGDYSSEAPPMGESADVQGPSSEGLNAGSVDDNVHYAQYLDYLTRVNKLNLVTRDFDPRGRVVLSVTGSNDLPAAGEEVQVWADGAEVATLRTTADGTVRFLPALYGQPTDGSFEFRVGEASVEAHAGSTAELEVDQPGGVEGRVPVDILFLLDATGSMGDEIYQLTEQIDSVAERVAALEGNPDVRFAMTRYRDEGDEFLTATYDFTDNVDAFRNALDDVVADGGGDYPEALEEGLAEALEKPDWRPAGEAVQLVFLVADAPPQTTRDVQQTYPDSVREAVSRGVKIFPVASSESDDLAELTFRQMAQATGAPFVFLAYGAGGAATGENSDIGPQDYETMSLDDLIVRLTAEEVADITGTELTVPTTPQEPDSTTPPGQ